MNRLRDDREEDLRLPATNHTSHGNGDREFTLGTGTVLGIFMALTLMCAIFFGFGYTMGRKSLAASTTPDTTDTASDAFGKFKPSPATTSSQSYTVTKAPPTTAPAVVQPAVLNQPSSSSAAAVSSAPVADTVRTPAPVERIAPPTATPSVTTTPASTGPVMVQVAAVSHQEDADVLTSALRRRGYSVIAHQDTNDHLVHIQVGPFPTRKDAEAMRQRLLADGYNAILK